MSVEYRDIPGYPGYRVGSDGSVWTEKNNHGLRTGVWKKRKLFLKGRDCNKGKGYLMLPLTKNNKQKFFYVHTLVLMSFIGERPAGHVACHNNGNRQDNRVENLRWDTPASNKADELIHGTRNRGERCGQSKFTESVVKEVRRLKKQGLSYSEIGNKTGMCKENAWHIATYRTWKNID